MGSVNNEIKYLTSGETAIRLRITPQHVARLVREGKLPALRIVDGRKLLIPEESVEQALRPARADGKRKSR
jgi:DNA binding domain, excisionase family